MEVKFEGIDGTYLLMHANSEGISTSKHSRQAASYFKKQDNTSSTNWKRRTSQL